MKKIPKLGCICEKPPMNQNDYRSSEVGTDHTNGRHGEVTIQQCKLCQRIWVHYLAEFEHYSHSGRWYKGIVAKKDLSGITPENAVAYLESLEWYLYGGSFFGNTFEFGQGKVNVDV